MAEWSNTDVATLKVRSAQSTDTTFTFTGVNSANSAGSPDDFLAAANRLLAIGGLSATITGIRREIIQEAIQNG